MYNNLATLRDALALISGVATCKIGLEANMSPADYPLIRIVPTRIRTAAVNTRRRAEVLIYFGVPIHEFDGGLESLYSHLFTLEQTIIDTVLSSAGWLGFYTETITDEDRLDAYKLMACRCDIEGDG